MIKSTEAERLKLEKYQELLEQSKSILLEARSLAKELGLIFSLDSLQLLGENEVDEDAYDSSDWDDSSC